MHFAFFNRRKIRGNETAYRLKLTTGVCLALVLLALPWPVMFNWQANFAVAGLPVPFFIAIIVVPLCIVMLTVWYLEVVDNIDSRAPDTENE